jgi:hypothetical protein
MNAVTNQEKYFFSFSKLKLMFRGNVVLPPAEMDLNHRGKHINKLPSVFSFRIYKRRGV